MESIYKLVDNIYCINLISRHDRYEHMKLFEKEENIKLDFYRPKKHPINGRIGCFTSHVKCIQDAFLKNYSMIMIFEDDVKKTPHYNKIDYEEIKNVMIEDTTWEMLKFSSITNLLEILKPNEYNFIYNGPTLLGTAYILNEKGIKRVMNTFTKYIESSHVDVYYYQIFSNTTYNVFPIPFDQRWDMGSDNIWEWTLLPQIQTFIRNILNYDVIYYTSLAKYFNGILIMFVIFMFVNKKIFGFIPHGLLGLIIVIGLLQKFFLQLLIASNNAFKNGKFTYFF